MSKVRVIGMKTQIYEVFSPQFVKFTLMFADRLHKCNSSVHSLLFCLLQKCAQSLGSDRLETSASLF